eukprot:1411450-Rhodomonas_salina.1
MAGARRALHLWDAADALLADRVAAILVDAKWRGGAGVTQNRDVADAVHTGVRGSARERGRIPERGDVL